MDKEFFETSNIDIAASLLCLGYDIEGINPVNPNKIVFYFDPVKYANLDNDVSKYWRGELSVNPKDFASNRRDLLTRIKESKLSLGGEYNDR